MLTEQDHPHQDRRTPTGTSRPSYPESRQPRDESAGLSNRIVDLPRGYPARLSHDFSGSRIERPPRHSHHPDEGFSRPRLNERDICPICRRALPPRGADGDETAREAHIVDCIRARDPTYHGEDGGGPSQARVHMLPFTATEKDCVAQDGNVQECSICMVEYNVGDELARLECLCKFHKECIVEWLGRKAECPVHKLIT